MTIRASTFRATFVLGGVSGAGSGVFLFYDGPQAKLDPPSLEKKAKLDPGRWTDCQEDRLTTADTPVDTPSMISLEVPDHKQK